MTGNSRHSGYDRNADDWYQEPGICVDRFLAAQKFHGVIWDPACGGGNIPKRCEAAGYSTIASDLRDRGYGETGVDFLKSQRPVDNIVTNPPFKLAEEFARHALTIVSDKVAMLVRLSVLEGQKRRVLFRETPVARIWIHSSRVSMPPGGRDIPAQNGSIAYCWVVWERSYRGEPIVGWLP